MDGMIGNVPLFAWQAERDLLEARIAGSNGTAELEALRRFNRYENPWPASRSRRTMWGPVSDPRPLMSVEFGSLKSPAEYMEALIRGNKDISPTLKDILADPNAHISIVPCEEQWDLVTASCRDMGFTWIAPLREIYERAFSSELNWRVEELPPEAGLAIRLVYEQPQFGERLLVAALPIPTVPSDQVILCIENIAGRLKLLEETALPSDEFPPDSVWVLGRRRKVLPSA